MKDENAAEELVSSLREYLNLQLEILKLTVIDRIAGSASGFIAGIVFLVIAIMGIFALNISAGLYFSAVTGSYALGFLLLAGIYLLLLLVLVIFRKPVLLSPIKNKMIRQLLGKMPNNA